MRVNVQGDHREIDEFSDTVMAIDPNLLRDYFAAQAIGVFRLDDSDLHNIVTGQGEPQQEQVAHERVARFCYGLADAMMRERSKQ